MGTGVAIVTPFKSDTSIDFNAFGKVVEHVIEGGVNYIVGLGTTGEATTLSKIEKQAVITFLTDSIGKRVPLVIGVGGNNTQEVINFIKGDRSFRCRRNFIGFPILQQTRTKGALHAFQDYCQLY